LTFLPVGDSFQTLNRIAYFGKIPLQKRVRFQSRFNVFQKILRSIDTCRYQTYKRRGTGQSRPNHCRLTDDRFTGAARHCHCKESAASPLMKAIWQASPAITPPGQFYLLALLLNIALPEI
jgi:hypothetical protein